MKEIRYICCQPAIPFYTWQVEVMINNFLKMGITPNSMDIVCAIENDIIPDAWLKLRTHFNSVRFFFYNDTRLDKIYPPSVYFNMMKQHIVAHPEILQNTLFLHDCDIVFTKPPNFNSMIFGNAWYLSDTNSYINYEYIQQKGNHVYEQMCDIIGIDKLIPKLMNLQSGGAQYIVKDTTFEYWDKVEKDSIALYKHFCDTEHLHVQKGDQDYPIQKWTAGMWSLLWNAWLFGHETIVDKRMEFTWVTNMYETVEQYGILHNAGVGNNTSRMFFKGEYATTLPYNVELDIAKEKASYYYYQQIKETAKNSCLINYKRKVAIGLYGIHYIDGLNHWMPEWTPSVDYKKCLQNNIDFVFNDYDTTFYSSTYFSDKTVELYNDYKFKSLKLSEIDNTKDIDIKTSFIKRNRIFRQTIELILADNIEYDSVILMRYDMKFKTKLPNIDYTKVSITNKTIWGENRDLTDDCLYVVPFNILKQFYGVVCSIPEDVSAHEWHKYIKDIHWMIDEPMFSHLNPTYEIVRGNMYETASKTVLTDNMHIVPTDIEVNIIIDESERLKQIVQCIIDKQNPNGSV